jgi:hypothetical protein
MRLKGDGIQLLEQQRLRLIVGTQPALFHDDLDLLRELPGIEVRWRMRSASSCIICGSFCFGTCWK